MKKRMAAAGSPDEARASAEWLARAGIRRLVATDLLRWNELRQALATRSRAVCSGLWTGRLDPATVHGAVATLDEADLDDWWRISTTAMRLGAESSLPVAEDLAALDRAVVAISGRLAEVDQERLFGAIAAGDEVTDDEACWAVQTLMRTVVALEPVTRDEALRALAAL